jgi:hypothetical protein
LMSTVREIPVCRSVSAIYGGYQYRRQFQRNLPDDCGT